MLCFIISLLDKLILLINGGWLIKLSHAFVFPDPESPIINVLCGRSGIWGQFGLSWLKIIQKYIAMENDAVKITIKNR